MFWHSRVFKEAQTVTRNAVTKFDIPENVPLGSIFLEITCKKAAGNPMGGINKWRLIDYLDSIDVYANGSTVIKSVPAQVIAAQNVFDGAGYPPHQFREYSQDTDRVYILLNFGRYYHDPEMYLPAGRFDSLELRINFSGTSTYWGEDASLDIILEQPSGAGVPASRGYIRSEVWREWTTVADEWKYFTMPTEYIIRRIILQAIPDVDSDYIEKTNMFNLMDEIRLAQKAGDVEIYHNGLSYLARMNAIELGGLLRTQGWIYHTADKGFNVGLGYVYAMVTSSGSRDGAGSATIPTVEGDRNSFTQKAETYEADSPIGFEAIGLCPECCVAFRFDHDPDPMTWLDPRAVGDVLLDIHTRNASSAAGGTNRVILDRYVPL